MGEHEKMMKRIREQARTAADKLKHRHEGREPEVKHPEETPTDVQKDEHGCIIGKELWDQVSGKCVPMPKEFKGI
jgi:hypothetical protein